MCGTAILQSPFNYTGTTGPYTSGTAGLPTYGTPSSDFPNATAGVVVGPSGFNVNSGAYNNSQTVYYFEPGNYLTAGETLFPGFDAVYIGGYANGAGAVLDAQGENNGIGAIQPVDQNGTDSTDVTLEYLTVKDYASSKNSSVINTPGNNGWVEEYDTIGPNEYAYPAASGQDNGGGYGIDLSSHNVIAYDCLINNAQGAINMPNGAGSESGQGATLNVDSVVTNNEISFNGLGEYPDDGNNPQSCGCSGGGKFSWSTNFVFEDNYVHDNYNAGIWGDFNNSGANISYNYIAYNWSWGVMYEASYNANISDNTLIGNGGGKMSDGSAWPSTSYSCNSAGSGSPTCAEGYGPNTGTWGNPYGTIQLNGSGGNSLADSNFNGPSTGCPNGYTDGCVLVQGNVLTNNFGAVQIFEDSGRASGTEPNQDGQCNSPLQGADSTYYQNTAQESDGDISTTAGSTTITSGDGGFSLFFSSQCTNPGPVTTPAAGLNVITNTSDIPYGDQIASCSSASTCTLTTAATGTAAGLPVDLSGTGGCSLADLTTANGPPCSHLARSVAHRPLPTGTTVSSGRVTQTSPAIRSASTRACSGARAPSPTLAGCREAGPTTRASNHGGTSGPPITTPTNSWLPAPSATCSLTTLTRGQAAGLGATGSSWPVSRASTSTPAPGRALMVRTAGALAYDPGSIADGAHGRALLASGCITSRPAVDRCSVPWWDASAPRHGGRDRQPPALCGGPRFARGKHWSICPRGHCSYPARCTSGGCLADGEGEWDEQ